MTRDQRRRLLGIRRDLAALCRELECARDQAPRVERADRRRTIRALENGAASLSGAMGDRDLHPTPGSA